jgi:hypothetical protein
MQENVGVEIWKQTDERGRVIRGQFLKQRALRFKRQRDHGFCRGVYVVLMQKIDGFVPAALQAKIAKLVEW